MRSVSFVAAVLGVTLLFSGCKEDADQSPSGSSSPGVAACTSGIDRAVKASTTEDATRIYYTECSTLFAQPACRDAWLGAAKLPPARQIPEIAEACRKAYCPAFAAQAFEACRDDFTSTPASLLRAWPPLFDAILTREAPGAAPEVTSAMLVLYARLRQLGAAAPPSATAAVAAGSAVEAASGAAPGSAAPAISASAAPPAPSTSAHRAAKSSPLKAKP